MLDQITSTLGVLLDVDWQHNFKSFYETVRVKILCKDPSKIPAERLFGVGNKIYRLLIEVESLTPTETGTSTNLSAGTYVSAAETGTNLTEDAESNRSSRSESDKGPATNSGPLTSEDSLLATIRCLEKLHPLQSSRHTSLILHTLLNSASRKRS